MELTNNKNRSCHLPSHKSLPFHLRHVALIYSSLMAPPYSGATDSRWLSIVRREENSSFLYGVITTRIFCRSACPGRVARRSNVVYFDDREHAARSGYRPCKRCEPCNDAWSPESQGRAIANQAASRIAAAEASRSPWTVGIIARALGISEAHLHRQFKRWFRTTPKSFGASVKRSAPKTTSSHQTKRPEVAPIHLDTSELLLPASFDNNVTAWAHVNVELGLDGNWPASPNFLFDLSTSFLEANGAMSLDNDEVEFPGNVAGLAVLATQASMDGALSS